MTFSQISYLQQPLINTERLRMRNVVTMFLWMFVIAKNDLAHSEIMLKFRDSNGLFTPSERESESKSDITNRWVLLISMM